MADSNDGPALPPKLNAAIDLLAGVIAGWLLAQGGEFAVLSLVLLAFLAVNVLAPPRLQARLHFAVITVAAVSLLADVFLR